MRGPSSSHVAASVRIGNLARQLSGDKLKRVVIEFERHGAIAPTYHSQGTDIGLAAGLLGLTPDDQTMPISLEKARGENIDIKFKITDFIADHPNTIKMMLADQEGKKIHLKAISVGGGLIEIKKIEEFSLSICGDFYETLLFYSGTTSKEAKKIVEQIKKEIKGIAYIDLSENSKQEQGIINLKSSSELSPSKILWLQKLKNILYIKQLDPVMPVVSIKDCIVPYNNASETLSYWEKNGGELWELAALYESSRGKLTQAKIFYKMREIVNILKLSIETGLKGTSYQDRILGPQAWLVEKATRENKLIPGGVLNHIIAFTMAMMEVKSSMGLIVAAPTAGSCGAVPGAIFGTAQYMNLDNDKIIKAMLAAGIIGVFISEQATFSAEVCGCQAECGAASAMAAAGLIQLIGGNVKQGIDAASIALQNMLGLICDPVANRVEVPCLGKNVMAATNAFAAANMVIAGVDVVIPLDETIKAMYDVGIQLPSSLRCTAKGGLSITKTAQAIDKKINDSKKCN
ncbi:MAG: L-serine ammonia-lyase, iron-sulfur-dependent, subunit alpha [Candidatus Atribacteria bacterium]|nr:L-serine ammonia-lyase, iron-sulfur-dependent, subunit alpha [Candidatus Atribacteria bacterium]